MHLTFERNNNETNVLQDKVSPQEDPPHVIDDPPIIDFSLPITQTYLNHMRNRGYYSDYSGQEEVTICL